MYVDQSSSLQTLTFTVFLPFPRSIKLDNLVFSRTRIIVSNPKTLPSAMETVAEPSQPAGHCPRLNEDRSYLQGVNWLHPILRPFVGLQSATVPEVLSGLLVALWPSQRFCCANILKIFSRKS